MAGRWVISAAFKKLSSGGVVDMGIWVQAVMQKRENKANVVSFGVIIK